MGAGRKVGQVLRGPRRKAFLRLFARAALVARTMVHQICEYSEEISSE